MAADQQAVDKYVLPHEILVKVVRTSELQGDEILDAYDKFMLESNLAGRIGLHKFQKVYGDIFPHGNADLFAENLFHCFDENGNDWIEFREFLAAMSVLVKGSLDKKLEWAFKIYDTDKNNEITKEELESIVKSLYKMYGSEIMNADFKMGVKDLTESMFSQMDLNGDGKVTLEEFTKAAKSNDYIMKILAIDPHTYATL